MSLNGIYVIYAMIFVGAVISAVGVILNNKHFTEKLNKAQAELIQKTDKIEELNNRIQWAVTGGDAFCNLSVTMIGPQNDAGTFVVVNEGKYPMYDVQITIVDLGRLKRFKPSPTLQDILSSQYVVDLGNVSPSTAKLVQRIDFGGRKELRFNIFTCARNGTTSQPLRMKLINNKWVCATKVTRLKGDTEEVLCQEIDEAYPRNKNGDVDW